MLKRFFLALFFSSLFFACSQGSDTEDTQSQTYTTENQIDSSVIAEAESNSATLEELEKAAENPEEVTEIDLEGKNLKELPEVIFKFPNLEVLYLGNNPELDWKKTFESLSKIKQLKGISLAQNNLKTLSEDLNKLENLEKIWLDLNTELDFSQAFTVLAKLPKLKELSLRENTFEKIPDNIKNLKNLESLFLSYNDNLAEINPSLAEIPKLTVVELIGTKNIDANQSFGALAKVKSLKILIFNKNEMVAVPIEVQELTQIEELWLEDDGLKMLPDVIGNLKNLKVLRLMNNPLEDAEIEKVQGMLPQTKVMF